MKFLVLLLLGVSSAFAANSAVLGQFPYHADIFAHNQESYKNCDGVLIRHNWVLSVRLKLFFIQGVEHLQFRVKNLKICSYPWLIT